jgi:transcriptional regulator with XRE-family HTH domain
MESTDIQPWETLLAKTRKALGQNLNAAKNVAGKNPDNGDIEPMSIESMHHSSDLSRSTLGKVMQNKASAEKSNPDLETLCRLAVLLKVPPALLLMSADDWQCLIQALNGIHEATGPHFEEMLVHGATGATKVSVGLSIAEGLKLHPIRTPDPTDAGQHHLDMKRDIEVRNIARRQAILCTTAIAQNAARHPGDLVQLTAIGALLGTNYKSV